MTAKHKIGILGGTGKEGRGLAARLAHAGYHVRIGSRDAEKAQLAAAALLTRHGGTAIGSSNAEAATEADIVILAVPYAAQISTAQAVKDELAGKILIDATVPLMPPKVAQVQLPGAGSSVAHLQDVLGESVRVISAFQNVSSHHLLDLEKRIECDVLVCGNDDDACDTVLALLATIGMRGIYAGPIANSAAAEALTSVLIAINRRYKVKASGIVITGLDPEPDGTGIHSAAVD